MPMRHLRPLIAALAVATLAGASFNLHARDLVVALKTEPSSMDPQYHALTPNIQLSQTLLDPLTCADADSAPKPCLAESWKVDGTTWTFKLRPNLKFSDGSPVTAQDVVFTFDRVPKVPNSPSSYTIYLQQITKVEAPDPLTVRITTAKPYPLVATNLANLPILSAKAAAGPAPEGKTTTEMNAGNGLVGAGPYKFVSWKRGSEIIFERNPHYWGPKPAWDRVIYRPISNPAARVAALLAGDVDLVEDPPTDDLARLQKDPKLTVVTKPSNRIIYVALDQNGEQTPGITGADGKPLPKNPMLDKRVREALSLAIDRKALVDRIMGGVATPAAQLLPYPMEGASDKLTQAAKPDPERAKALLKEAGYPNGFNLVLGAPNGRYINDSKVAQTLAAMWTRIGVKTTIDSNAPPVFFKNRDTYAYSAYLAGWSTATGEMSNTLNALLVTPNKEKGLGTTNRSRYSNPEMDRLVDASAAVMDAGKRSALLAKASELAMADFAMLPVHFEHSVWAMKKGLTLVGRSDQMTMVQYVTPAK
ncbi:ABC transporter substrate-binding protein [Aquincola tertiaricarbonis]|uniref:ABC transporter substrate-binding protein n=1 Tax=Aquincola tertiaricarbonis TaxID=391953 RepID=A0ABY4S4E5_AQUTE|nr:ABC transporter substrate-binding protein [Aquincola tertiaricarbonis]URI07095.1 ABC transporter substrate-binding protein [Aquincola tertiaricarbonis]